MKKSLILFALAACTSLASAQVVEEMEGMGYETRADGTFLIGGPTFVYDRILGAGGIHSESELWNPSKLRDRLLFNRMSVTPSWTPLEAGVWMKTGNELGDLIYQDFVTPEDRPANRTPILEAGFRTPVVKGFWATARLFQDDHFSSAAYGPRVRMVDDSFSFFGENWPLFSSAYGGLGYTNSLVNASVLAGEEYIWVYSETSRWIPIHYKPRVEARVDVGNLSVTAVYEDAEYQNVPKKEQGSRKEVSGSIYYKCGEACKKGMLQLSAGLAFRAVDDSGTVYTELEDDRVFLPFMELRVQPVKRLTADVMFAVNERDWLVQDSVQFHIPVPKDMAAVVGVKNISGTRMNPIADTREFYGERSIDLVADGQMNLIQGYAGLVDTLGDNVSIGVRGSYWAEYGAETFDPDAFGNEEGMRTRYGDASRINTWIKGITGELSFDAWYGRFFDFEASAGFEHIDGPVRRFEVTPAEYFVGFAGNWLINETFKISHSVHYRSDAEWNLRTIGPMVAKGGWFWDASFEQQFPKYGIYLTGTLMHALGDEMIEVPNGGFDRFRFICGAKKTF
ncbi:MAG: hypothetical protein MJZ26_08230 [Fibrobacter sp.]|nr:hypothetical protein [Fibrobacter sp.]